MTSPELHRAAAASTKNLVAAAAQRRAKRDARPRATSCAHRAASAHRRLYAAVSPAACGATVCTRRRASLARGRRPLVGHPSCDLARRSGEGGGNSRPFHAQQFARPVVRCSAIFQPPFAASAHVRAAGGRGPPHAATRAWLQLELQERRLFTVGGDRSINQVHDRKRSPSDQPALED
ncbi:hypothetical protein F511_10855 [Dorcoceras hygrometricum]|uniref:Uncharacterized protein n=1 Tax=Dorcoceras hygrometricum TaxID=472368 RepID=A0A2Z7AUB8_9LAMI|nr:hypothetical protein F511_10855 [Dorcoceras hygrometricum]